MPRLRLSEQSKQAVETILQTTQLNKSIKSKLENSSVNYRDVRHPQTCVTFKYRSNLIRELLKYINILIFELPFDLRTLS
jgi:hypothetical protein